MKLHRWFVVTVAASPLLLIAPVILALSGTAAASCEAQAQAGGGDIDAIARQVQQLLAGQSGSVNVPGLDNPAEQLPNAKTIVATGVALKIPARGQTIALATALQESGLRNLSYGDRDSLGLFQQRPSQGWGTAAQIQDPVFASTAFYRALIAITGWESVTIGQAAQSVQKSAYPDAYDKWVPLATALQQAITQAANPTPTTTPTPPSTAPTAGPSTDPASPTAPAPQTTSPPPASIPPPAQSGLAGCSFTPGGDGSGFGDIPAGALPDGYTIPADAPEPIRTAIRWALGQLGTPYQWGGTCMDARGPDPMGRCDCSSLMQRAYAAGGIILTRTTYTQVNEGIPIPLDQVEQLRPGDLVFTRGTAAVPEHVGMVIGSGLIVNAPKTGDVVRIATIADWKADILAIRRIVP